MTLQRKSEGTLRNERPQISSACLARSIPARPSKERSCGNICRQEPSDFSHEGSGARKVAWPPIDFSGPLPVCGTRRAPISFSRQSQKEPPGAEPIMSQASLSLFISFMVLTTMLLAIPIAMPTAARCQPSPIGRVEEDNAEARRVPGTLIYREGRENRPSNPNFFRPDDPLLTSRQPTAPQKPHKSRSKS